MSISEERLRSLPWGPGVELIATHPAGLLAVSKPSGVLSHPNDPRDESRSLLRVPYSLSAERFDGTPPLWLLHRLDGPTSGVILLATSEAVARAAKEAFAGKDVRKVYRALVFGNPSARADVWSDRLSIERAGGTLRTRVMGGRTRQPDRLPAPSVTEVRVLSRTDTEFGWITQLELQPRTGRTHQLRVQCQRHNLPIVGDQTYGDFKRNRAYAKATGEKRLFLHAQRVTLRLPGTPPVEFTAEAPLPRAFAAGER